MIYAALYRYRIFLKLRLFFCTEESCEINRHCVQQKNCSGFEMEEKKKRIKENMNYENRNTMKEMTRYTENVMNIMTMESVYK